MTPNQMEQDFHFLRSQVQRLSRLIDALESSPLLVQAMTEPAEAAPDMPQVVETEILPLAELERDAIMSARAMYGKNSDGACAALGIGKTTYYRKLREYGVRG